MKLAAVVCGTILLTGAALASPEKTSKIDRSPPASERITSFDGRWTLEVSTSAGNCPALLPTEMAIVDNRIVEAAGIRTASWGYVESDGSIFTRFTNETHVARFYGQLRGTSGSGAWSSNSDYCGGTWKASRREAEHAAR